MCLLMPLQAKRLNKSDNDVISKKKMGISIIKKIVNIHKGEVYFSNSIDGAIVKLKFKAR